MTYLIRELNRVCSTWKNIYDVFSELNLSFSTDNEGRLFFNGEAVEIKGSPCLIISNYTSTDISFYFSEGFEIQICIAWTEDAPPVVMRPSINYNYLMEEIL